MTLGIFTVASRGDTAGDTYNEALDCYKELADTVHVNDRQWPKEFRWEHIGQTFQDAYEHTNADWVIHCDCDFIFHEQDFIHIRQVVEANEFAPALSFYKYQFILPDRYTIKSRLVLAVNKKRYGDRIKFNSGGDLCQPSLDGEYISPESVPEAGIAFYNYEKLCKTKDQIKDDIERMDRAYKRTFDKSLYSRGSKSAYDGWYDMVKGRFNKPAEHIALERHPKFMQETIKNLTPEQFGYNGFGLIEGGVYR